jgi:tRNA(fMet)-specific endonuclease VapC
VEVGRRLILDTNALSALAEDKDGIVEALGSTHELAIPVVVLGEYRYGIAFSRDFSHYAQWLDELIESCRVLVVDEKTTRHYADIRVELKCAGTPIPANDIWVAALARQHALSILSRDHHFDKVKGIRRATW